MLENHLFFDLKAHFQWFSNSVTHGVGKLLKLSHSTWRAFTFWVQMRHFEWFSHHVHSVVSHEFFPGLIESRIFGNYPLYAHGGWLPTFCILIACHVREWKLKIVADTPSSAADHRASSAEWELAEVLVVPSVWALSVRHIKDNMRFSFSTFTFELLLFSLYRSRERGVIDIGLICSGNY